VTASRLVDPGLFTGSEALTLRGTRCAGCGTTTFPAQETCPKCFTQDMRDEPLPRSGSVWSWTVQHFAPKPPFRVQPGGFVPYLLGYVDLGPVVIETRLAGSAEEPPSIGDDVDLVPLTAYVDDDGTEVVTFAFAAAGHAATPAAPPGGSA
jgi:uncharacterized OB-fold protein